MNIKWEYLLAIPVFIILIYIGKYATISPFIIFSIIFSMAAAIITFQKPENGLAILIFSMLLSPEIIIAKVPGREVTIRIDDLLIVIVFLAWLAYTAVNKDWKGFIKTPIDKTLLFLVFLYVLSTAWGMISGNIKPVKGFFYTMKYIEYFMLYWLAANIIGTTKDFSRYLKFGLITCIIVTLFAYSTFNQTERVSAPFETGGGEPASLGGYYLIIFSILAGFFLHLETLHKKMACLGMIIFLIPPFAKTLSRASYVGFAILIITMLLFTKRGKITFIILIILSAILTPLYFKNIYTQITKRIMVTFTGGHYSSGADKYSNLGIGKNKITDESALLRIESWNLVINKKFPQSIRTILIGNGVTGIGFVEGQFFLVLGELGILGTIAFYWLFGKILYYSYKIYKKIADISIKSLSLALIGSTAALLFQSLTTNTFIIVRIMEPFWFLAAMVIGVALKENESILTA